MRGVLTQIAMTCATLSVVSIGGANAALPEIHRQAVDILAWMNDETFARLFAIAQIAPGPNILLVSLIGWRVAGLAGLLVATFAILAPSSLMAFGVGRAVAHWKNAAWVQIAKSALAPIGVGLILASGIVAARAADQTLLAYAVTAASAAFIVLSGRNPLWALTAGAVVGLIATTI
jgi:chromate transporter